MRLFLIGIKPWLNRRCCLLKPFCFVEMSCICIGILNGEYMVFGHYLLPAHCALRSIRWCDMPTCRIELFNNYVTLLVTVCRNRKVNPYFHTWLEILIFKLYPCFHADSVGKLTL